MWNICRAQCPSYLVDRNIFGKSSSSTSFYTAAANSSSAPVVASKVKPPVTTLSPSYWLPLDSVDASVESNSKTNNPKSISTRSSPHQQLSDNGPEPTSHQADIVIYEQPNRTSNSQRVPLSDNIGASYQQCCDEFTSSPQVVSTLDDPSSTVLDQVPIDTMDHSHNSGHPQQAGGGKTMTEYKRQFQWNAPITESKPVKLEPVLTQYQVSFGGAPETTATHLNSSPSYSRQSSNEKTDASSSTTMARSPTPGGAIKSSVLIDCASIVPQFSVDTKKSSSVLFNYEAPPRPPSPVDLTKQSEYHAKFKPFNDYVYLEGDGFKKETQLTSMEKKKKVAKSWLSEVEERSRQACQYRARSRNGATPVNPDQPWNGVTIKDRNLQALALATRLIIEEKKSERKARSASVKPTTRNASRNLNSAPPSLRDESSPAQRSVRGQIRKTLVTNTKSSAEQQVDKNNNVGKTPTTKSTRPPAPSVTRPSKRDSANTNPAANTTGNGSQKVWIKPKKSAKTESEPSSGEGAKVERKVSKPKQSTPPPPPSAAAANNTTATPTTGTGTTTVPATQETGQFEPEPKSVALRTTDVKSPEQLTGIKSPSPESWKVSIEKGGLNWVNGNTPVNFDGKFNQTDQMVRPVPINASINNNDDLYGPLSA